MVKKYVVNFYIAIYFIEAIIRFMACYLLLLILIPFLHVPSCFYILKQVDSLLSKNQAPIS